MYSPEACVGKWRRVSHDQLMLRLTFLSPKGKTTRWYETSLNRITSKKKKKSGRPASFLRNSLLRLKENRPC